MNWGEGGHKHSGWGRRTATASSLRPHLPAGPQEGSLSDSALVHVHCCPVHGCGPWGAGSPGGVPEPAGWPCVPTRGLVRVGSWHPRRDFQNGQDPEVEMVQRCDQGRGRGTRLGQLKSFSPLESTGQLIPRRKHRLGDRRLWWIPICSWRRGSKTEPSLAHQQHAESMPSFPAGGLPHLHSHWDAPRLSPETFSKAVLELIYLSCPCKFRFIR